MNNSERRRVTGVLRTRLVTYVLAESPHVLGIIPALAMVGVPMRRPAVFRVFATFLVAVAMAHAVLATPQTAGPYLPCTTQLATPLFVPMGTVPGGIVF